MIDQEVFNWATVYVANNSKTALAVLTGEYSRTAISLYLNGKYGARASRLEASLRLLMDSRHCPFLGWDIRADNCASRAARKRPQIAGSEMEAHWLACQGCQYNKGAKS